MLGWCNSSRMRASRYVGGPTKGVGSHWRWCLGGCSQEERGVCPIVVRATLHHHFLDN